VVAIYNHMGMMDVEHPPTSKKILCENLLFLIFSVYLKGREE
jgi:hypothetical protein